MNESDEVPLVYFISSVYYRTQNKQFHLYQTRQVVSRYNEKCDIYQHKFLSAITLDDLGYLLAGIDWMLQP
jgi:hypothetical protein